MLEVDLAGLGTRSQKRRIAGARVPAARQRWLTASVPRLPTRLSSNRPDRRPTTCASVCLLATAPTLLCQLQTLSSAAFLLWPASPHPTPNSRSNLPCSLRTVHTSAFNPRDRIRILGLRLCYTLHCDLRLPKFPSQSLPTLVTLRSRSRLSCMSISALPSPLPSERHLCSDCAMLVCRYHA